MQFNFTPRGSFNFVVAFVGVGGLVGCRRYTRHIRNLADRADKIRLYMNICMEVNKKIKSDSMNES